MTYIELRKKYKKTLLWVSDKNKGQPVMECALHLNLNGLILIVRRAYDISAFEKEQAQNEMVRKLMAGALSLLQKSDKIAGFYNVDLIGNVKRAW